MIRGGKYALYHGKEYRFVGPKGNYIELVSHNKEDINDGFSYYAEGVFIKNVSLEEVENLFKISSKARYKGELFPVSEEGKTGKVLLDTTNTELAKKMGFERTDKYMYSKYVNWDEVEIIEQRKPYLLE